MDGIINVLKPPGMTSFDVVAQLRGILAMRKIGHAGTLDPLAVGVLPVCAGKATGAIEFLMDKDKLYRAELTLGIETDTQDASGKILKSVKPVCTDTEIADSVRSFIGIYHQMPPMYSALKVDGKKLYELARNGLEIERQARPVEIFDMQILSIDRSDGVKVLLEAHCSKGTYIRTLCADIGERLGCGGHMSFLLRKRAGPYDIRDACTLEELADRKREGTLETVLLPVETVFSAYPKVVLDEGTEKKFRNGLPFPADDLKELSGSAQAGESTGPAGLHGSYAPYRVHDTAGRFIALGFTYERSGNRLFRVKKFF